MLFRSKDHIDGEKVEEDEVGSHDRIDEPRDFRRIRIPEGVEENDDPRSDPGDGSEDEGRPIGILFELIDLFHQQAEPVHRGVQEEDGDQGADVIDTEQLGDQHDHHRRTQCIFMPTETVDPFRQIGVVDLVGFGIDDDEVGQSGEKEEGRYGDGEGHVPDFSG